jgi:hypothetical protein
MEETAQKPLQQETNNENLQNPNWQAIIDKEIEKQLKELGISNTGKETEKQETQVKDKIPLVNTPNEPNFLTNKPTPEAKAEINSSPREEAEPTTLEALDPLAASVAFALNNLKENDKINNEWTLKKIFKTNFGGNNSSFYELINSSGAVWTLNLEEMKDLLKKEITKDKIDDTLPNLGIEKPIGEAEQPSPKIETETKQVQEKPKSEPNLENLNKKDSFETKPSNQEHSEGVLTEEQIQFLKKLHTNADNWKVLITFSLPQWEKFIKLYQEGNLKEIGINNNPLFDYLNNPDFGSLVEVNKGETFSSILQKHGHKLKWTGADGPLFAFHVIANRKLLEDTARKAESLGLSVKKIPEDQELISLATKAVEGDYLSLQELSSYLQLIPTNQRVRVLNVTEVEKLTSFLKI